MRIAGATVVSLALSLSAVSALARDHGTTPGLEGPALGKAANPPESRKLSPGENNPTTAPVAPIGPDGPVPDAPGSTGTAPGQEMLACMDTATTDEEALACLLES